jgi:hypothetical protein
VSHSNSIVSRLLEVRELLIELSDLEQASWRACVYGSLLARGRLVGPPFDLRIHHGMRYIMALSWDADLFDPSVITTEDYLAAQTLFGDVPVALKLIALSELLSRHTNQEVSRAA